MAITAEQAQANLERKRQTLNGDTPLMSVNDPQEEMSSILSRVMSKPREPDKSDQDDAEAEYRRTAAEKRRNNPEPILSSIGIGRRHIHCSFETYQGKEKVVDVCKAFIENPADMVLTGAPGTGKTHLAAAILRELVRESHIRDREAARFVPVPELLAEIRACYRDGGPDERDIMDRYSSLPYLVLDDLGAEKTTEWSITTLYLIIDRRYRDMRPTIVTTNLTLEQIAATLSERISSRLAGGKIVTLKGEDYRMKRA